ncbi:MAG TPA: thiamine pyrophosphate-dependent dehydrogenase E1 component subunit alpha [Verrucomicrobiae bacterium]|nr:thiamine pyrophosphate-dependent dehydrogenase E1 component subunit alpha [Verrucomicrobiae bacterium]
MSQPLTRQQHLDLYYFMQLNRQLEERMVRLFRQNKIVGGLYSSLGQEGVSVGTAYALEKRDWLAPMIRNIGALLVKGVPPRDIFTQHMAKFTSPTKGKDGTSHFGDLKNLHIVSPISMLGDLIPVMTGVAMAGRYLGQNIVAMTWIGDGGSSTGAFHEGLGLASSQRAPFVLVIENNQWAYSTPVSRQVPVKNLADRAVAYGIASAIVDGNDVVAVYRAAKEAVDECRAGRGPRIIEVKTMRMRGHAQHDPAEYVPKEMFEFWKARDPIARYEKFLAAEKIWDAKAKAEIDSRIERELDENQKFAEDSPMPPPETAELGVYCDGCHAIEPEWKRSKKELTPPQSSVEAAWQVPGFGALDVSSGGNGAKPSAAPSPESSASENFPAASAPEVPRVPFGRGPKDKAFLAEQHAKTPPPRQHSHKHPPRKRGR